MVFAIDMGSRIRDNPAHVFECFCEISIPSSCNESTASIRKKFPETYKDEEILKSVPEFAYPCEFNNNAVQHFSFVLTSIDSKWTFGFCRHAVNSPLCFVILSYLPWHETFYKLLNHAAEIAYGQDPEELWRFLEILYKSKVPEPGLQLHVKHNNGKNEFVSNCPDHHKLPSIPENRNLTEYYSAVDTQNMMIIFASMLHERRILITSKKLSRLSACIQAANALIYPMHWQHIFIPVLPNNLLDYLSAPMPFLIGVPSSTLSRVKRAELGEIVLLDADMNKIDTPFNDLDALPPEVVMPLKRTLRNPNSVLGDGIPRAFLRALVQLIGGYWNALRLRQGEKITFNREAFVQSRPISMQAFLQKMLELQIFQQFIESRLHMLNCGKGCFTDEFEFELTAYEGKTSSRLKTQYKEWLSSMKKESGAFLKSVRGKVKDTSKRAYKDIRSRFHDVRHQKLNDAKILQSAPQPRSAPSSPSFSRTKVTTYVKERRGTAAVVEDIISTRKNGPLTKDTLVRNASEGSISDSDSSTFPSPVIDTDLMSDLNDVIFKYTGSLSENTEQRTLSSLPLGHMLNEKTSNQRKASTLRPTSSRISSLPPVAPKPPPRIRRRVNSDTVPQIPKRTDHKAPLIQLDSVCEDDVFYITKNTQSASSALLELEEAFSNLSSHETLQKAPLQSNPIYYTPFIPPRTSVGTPSSESNNTVMPSSNSFSTYNNSSHEMLASRYWKNCGNSHTMHSNKESSVALTGHVLNDRPKDFHSYSDNQISFVQPLTRKISSPAAISSSSSSLGLVNFLNSDEKKSTSLDNWLVSSQSSSKCSCTMSSWETFQ